MKLFLLILLTVSLMSSDRLTRPCHAATVDHVATVTAADDCPHAREVKRWKEWRQRNPNARSRYPKANHHVSTLSFGNASDPEPDPGGLGCGCPPDVALGGDGCGWFHSNIYG